MSERRPHWDDELVEAVNAAVIRMQHPELYPDAEVYDIIAAVEDWIDARGSAIDGREVVAAIAAVARVRNVCRDPTRQMRTTDPFWITVEWVDLNAVLNALDGPDE